MILDADHADDEDWGVDEVAHSMMRSAIHATAAALVVGMAAPEAGAQAPTVVVTGGELAGIAADGIYEYLGIPFAAPTGGEARFRPPRPATPWQGVRRAVGHGPQCPQEGFLPGTPPAGTVGEDCLGIDLYVPDRAPGGNLPIMVFFHGGGYTTGSNSQYDAPARMVAEGGVIVAIPNYRLGPFGFLSLPELAAESGGATGTLGIQDQQAALRWVRDNARAFGGDPDEVTIFGQSAGGASVCAHLAAPASDGLYRRAIVQSGACANSPLVPGDREDSFARSRRYAESVGCPDVAGRLACLRALPAAKLPASTNPESGEEAPTWAPVLDGVVVTRTLDAALARASDRQTELIIGSNSAEGVELVFETEYARGRIPDAASYERYVRATFGDDAARVLDRYRLDRFPSAAAAQSVVITDGLFACPALSTARAAQAAGTRVWQYEFDQAPFGPGNPLVPGAFHGAELPYLFGRLAGVPIPWTGSSEAFAQRMRRWWTAFAYSGDPNSSGDSPWWPARPEPAGQPSDGPVLVMRATGSVVAENFAAEHDCGFWLDDSR